VQRDKKSKQTNDNKSIVKYVTLWKGHRISLRSLLVICLLAFTFILYSGSLSHEFLIGWDDGEYITNPDVIHYGEAGSSSVFKNFYLGMYQPLAVLTFIVNYHISGDHAIGFILTNLLLHLFNTLLVYKLMMRWFKRFEPAFLVALLFALHPMHVEGVAWISTRSSLLYSLFFLAGLIQYEKYINNPKTGNYLLTLMWALLSLLSKSMAATFPLVLLLVDYLHQRKFSTRLILEKLPFLILSVIFGIVAIKASASFGHITVLEQDYPIMERLTLIAYGISFYLVKLIIPVNLSAIYAFPAAADGSIPGWAYTPVIALVVFIAVIWHSHEKRRLFIFGGLFFLLSISMVLPLFWSRIFITADRYTYIPYLGLFMIVASLLVSLWDKRDSFERSTVNMLYAASGLVFILFVATTFNRIKVWHNTPSLLTNVIEKRRSDADMAHGYFYLGNYYDTKGNDEEAIKYYNLALSRNPHYLLALNNRGILKGKHMDPGAVSDFDEAVTLKPDYAEAYYNRGVAYYQLQQPERACADWQEASRLGFKQANAIISQYCFKNTLPDFNHTTQ